MIIQSINQSYLNQSFLGKAKPKSLFFENATILIIAVYKSISLHFYSTIVST